MIDRQISRLPLAERPFPEVTPPRPPSARVQRRKLHGTQLVDDYPYFSDSDDAEVKNYIAEEGSYARKMLATLECLGKQLVGEFRRRVRQNDRSVSQYDAGYWYYTRWEVDKDFALHCRRGDHPGAIEEIYLDENELANKMEYFDLASLQLCPGHKYVAYAVDLAGNERYQIRARDLQTGLDLQIAKDVSDSFAWIEDGQNLVYVQLDNRERPYKALVHNLDATGEDRCIFEEHDPAFYVDVWKTRSREFVIIESHSNTTSEISFMSANDAGGSVRLIEGRNAGFEYFADHHGDSFLILASDNAANFELITTPVDQPGRENWVRMVAQREDTVLCYVEPYRNFVIVGELYQGKERFGVIHNGSNEIDYPDINRSVFSISVEDLDDYDSDKVRLCMSSPCLPEETWDYRVSDGTWYLLKQECVDGFDPAQHQCERHTMMSRDHTLIPITITRKTGCENSTGGSPLLLYAYGAYGDALDMEFDPELISLLDRGVVVVYAHVRGGGELGTQWHRAGQLLNKQNGILDFIDCASWLIQEGYTVAGQIAAWGGSAGGLLVAEAIRREPALFSSAVLESPFVDVINTLLDENLPMSAYDRGEFGNPHILDHFRVMVAYSPYDNVVGEYPPMLVTAGLNDHRVGYWEPLKWVARIRARSRDFNTVILKFDDAGHFGASGRYQVYEDAACAYAFFLRCWGIDGGEVVEH